MLSNRFSLIFICISFVIGAYAQKNDRDFVRRGNQLYQDSLFVKAEVEYRRALDVNPKSVEAMYNLGNALLMQQKAQEAMEQYVNASSLIGANEKSIALNEEDKARLAQMYHNMGVILQSSKQYDACIEAYKKSLRNNSADHETRYNLSVAQKMKKEQEEQQQQNQQQQNQEQEEQKEERQEEQPQQNQNQEQQKEQEQQQQEQQQPQQQNMSKENAEQMLKAMMQDEKEIQEKVQKAMQEVQPRKFDKDW